MSSISDDIGSDENWFTKNIIGGISDVGASIADLLSDVASNIVESVSDAYSGSSVPDFISSLVNPSSDGGESYASNYASRQGFAGATAYGDTKPIKDDGWGDLLKTFVKDNQKTLLEQGFGAVAGMAKASAAKDAAKYKAEADSALLTKKDQLEQDANKRFSDSLGGLSPVKPWKPKPLTRMDGSRVFTPTGLINTGAK